MAEEIRDLIEKINQEGILAAEEKAKNIEDAAKQKADDILNRAKLQAEEMIADAREKIYREDEKEKTLLEQAGRDLLLSLRNEINAMLGRLVLTDIRQSLTPEALFTLLSEVFKNYSIGERSDITVFLNTRDLEILEKYYLYKLGEETKKKIVLMREDEIRGGFAISYDSRKSCYDFSDKALAEYIGVYLKPKLKQILEGAMKE